MYEDLNCDFWLCVCGVCLCTLKYIKRGSREKEGQNPNHIARICAFTFFLIIAMIHLYPDVVKKYYLNTSYETGQGNTMIRLTYDMIHTIK